MKTFFALALILTFLSASCAAAPITNFRQSKQMLRSKVFFDQRKEFYCEEDFDEHLNVTSNRLFKSRKPNRRAKRIEWEHVVAAENFGRSFKEWREGHVSCVRKGKPFKGRKCAQKASAAFRVMEADPYNLMPAIGEVNEARANYRFSELPGVANYFGNCPFKLEDQRVEPRAAVKGDIARIYTYMEEAHKIKLISDAQKKLFEAWNKLDPVDAAECLRIQRISVYHPNPTSVWKECKK